MHCVRRTKRGREKRGKLSVSDWQLVGPAAIGLTYERVLATIDNRMMSRRLCQALLASTRSVDEDTAAPINMTTATAAAAAGTAPKTGRYC